VKSVNHILRDYFSDDCRIGRRRNSSRTVWEWEWWDS